IPLASSRERLTALRQPYPHLRDRLDGDDLRTARGEPARELPRTRREVEHPPARAESEPFPKQRNRRVRILRPPAVVELRDEAEGVRLRMDLRHGSRDRGR